MAYDPRGRRVRAIRLPDGTKAIPFSVKCRVVGCRRRKRGYLTDSYGGGYFCTRRGKLLADLRDQEFVCTEHES